jgi:aquaporin NIP
MLRRLLAEYIGTFLLVFVGTSAIVVNDLYAGVVTHWGISAVFGLIVMTMIYAVGDISGAHFNPAVTFAFWVVKRMESREVMPYILSQFVGALTGSAFIWALFPQHLTLGATISALPFIQTFLLELVLSFTLMFVIIHVSTGAKEKGLMAGAAIGGTVCLAALFAGPLTGASMNPARSFAPAVFAGQWASLGIYLTTPFIGTALGALTCRLLRGPDCCSEDLACDVKVK